MIAAVFDRVRALVRRARGSYKVAAVRTRLDIIWCTRAARRLRRAHPQGFWLFCERGDTAQDNAYHLFRHVRTTLPLLGACFVASTLIPDDYERVGRVGMVVEHGSHEHKVAYLAATHLVSTHARGMIEPWPHPHCYSQNVGSLKDKAYCFIDHGVGKDDNSDIFGAHAERGHFDLFCTVGERESDFVRDVYGYDPSSVRITGLARYDALIPSATPAGVLFAPTWRAGTVQPSWEDQLLVSVDDFLASDYFHKIHGLLNNRDLLGLLQSTARTLTFYPHFEVQPYIEHFTNEHPDFAGVVVPATVHTAHLQQLMVDTELMITDYSSVAFDVAYLGRPIVYYQFDEAYYAEHHYRPGYFDYRRDGFGPVLTTEAETVESVAKALASGSVVDPEHRARADAFFRFRDHENCRRIADAILHTDPRGSDTTA